MPEKMIDDVTLQTLPGDAIRQIMWRFSDRFDIQMLVQSTRAVARGPVARLVAEGARSTHDWTDQKAALFKHFDEAGITGAFLDPECGGMIEGPKNLLFALIAFELAWVDAGAATASLAGNLAFAPIHERGTPEQRLHYMQRMVPPAPGENRKPLRGAFGLTEPIPYVGVDTGALGGKVRIAEWPDGGEPILHVEKRGRFITNMDLANFVTAAVDSDDPRIKGSCMVILEETDPGIFDRGAPTRKLVHQLSSTRDPIFSLKVPASRIIGGYKIKDGVIIPNYSHGDIIEAVFRRTRITVGAMTAAKLLSAVEPVIRYQRGRFRGTPTVQPGSSRYELGLQLKEDTLHRLVDIWASGEAAASLVFAAARLFDEIDPLEREKDRILEQQGVSGAWAQMKVFRNLRPKAMEYVELCAQKPEHRDTSRFKELEQDPLVRYMVLDAVGNVLCPASKLWNTGHGANMMREALSLMGGYGITEDCPGFLAFKWMDAQLEATYEGPEAVQRRQLSITMTMDIFLAQFRNWIKEMRQIASRRPGTGACTLATAMEMWLWTLEHLQNATDANGNKLYHSPRQGVTFALADALCWLLASRYQIRDVLELEEKGRNNPMVAEGLDGTLAFLTDLCHVQSARASGEVGRICAELVHGYNRHPSWDGESCHPYTPTELDALESVAPGIAGGVAGHADIMSTEGDPHPCKAGPCVRFEGLETFTRMRLKLDGCLTGARLAKDRAAQALTKVMIPEALDYPQ
ncbi:MAG TPA: acyl-CoA dehydrogenase family protein [Candidatus Hydrogenedentes bacterium]|nr:acyl-CoA dehydrogenase family protein [Candidatus Hydrogenedentota bacterium]HOL75456.1 acyl-CoA dehydrogenase family protein [Candidatus Hydrogenedentota bacterium]HPO84965.1 acyl-CoA dehydrogenase family protein [Candidatus Hydrogenedentota bacterium]